MSMSPPFRPLAQTGPRAFRLAAGALAILTAGACSSADAQQGSKGAFDAVGLTTTVGEPADFVRAARPAPGSLDYIPVGAPVDEPRTKPLDAKEIARRMKAAQAAEPARAAIARRAPQVSAPSALPASALRARQEHERRMRERASGAE